MKPQCVLQTFLLCLITHFCNTLLYAHPIPDLPVFGIFDKNGSNQIIIEIDPRAFAKDPEEEPFLTAPALAKLDASSQKDLLREASQMLESSLLIRMNAQKWHLPHFQYEFTETNKKDENNQTIVLIQAISEIFLEGNATYQIKAKETATLDLIFTNQINGIPHRRVNVLFPGEESFVLNLPTLENNPVKITKTMESRLGNRDDQSESKHMQSTFLSFARQGFLHVLPLGMDHILFVLGIFLLSRKWKPLILQVSAFTLAHTITLGLATLGWISMPSSIVEPIIAASIAFVALENIFFPKYHTRRLILVFIFGLIHGLGFAGALSDLDLDPSVLLVSLVGFNLGVEGGQLAIILLSFAAVLPFQDEKSYRRRIVIPLSLIIAGVGIFWTIERIL